MASENVFLLNCRLRNNPSWEKWVQITTEYALQLLGHKRTKDIFTYRWFRWLFSPLWIAFHILCISALRQPNKCNHNFFWQLYPEYYRNKENFKIYCLCSYFSAYYHYYNIFNYLFKFLCRNKGKGLGEYRRKEWITPRRKKQRFAIFFLV